MLCRQGSGRERRGEGWRRGPREVPEIRMESLFGAAQGGLVAAEDERSELTKRALESLLVFQVCRRRVALFQCFLKQIFWFEFFLFFKFLSVK